MAEFKKEGADYVLMVERSFDHPPEKVWRAVTERELLRQWFPCDIAGDWHVDSALEFIFLHGEGDDLPEEDLQGEVVAIDKPHLLEFRWGKHFLKYEIVPDGDGSLFRLSEKFGDPSWGARNAAGWEMCLDSLAQVADGVAVAKFAAEIWTRKFKHYVEKFEPDFGPQHDPSGDHPLLADEDAGAQV